MAHLMTCEAGVNVNVLGIFDKVVDKNMAVFYNSLIATNLREKAIEGIDDIVLKLY